MKYLPYLLIFALLTQQQPTPGVTARATIDRVLDGDTVDVTITVPIRVRLKDCWAPELRNAGGPAAKQALKQLLPEGSKVIVDVPTGEARKVGDVFTFGRVVGDIWVEGREVGDEMIRMGHATREKQ